MLLYAYDGISHKASKEALDESCIFMYTELQIFFLVLGVFHSLKWVMRS